MQSAPQVGEPIRLALVNDHAIVVAGLHKILLPYADRVRVVELASQLPVVSDVDVLLYDTFGRERVDAVVERVLTDTDAKVVFYSWSLQPQLVAEATELGVLGFLSKTMDAVGLVEAIEKVFAGSLVMDSPPVPSAPLLEGAWPGQVHGLSVREAEVIALIAQGLSNQEVAERAFVSINSVKTYIRSAYRKIGVASRTQAVLWALAHGFERDTTRVIVGGGRGR